MSHFLVELYIHVIFSTKERMALIPENMESRLYGYIKGVVAEQRSSVLTINGVSDHLHIALRLHPSVALSDLIRNMKAYSTGWLKKQGVNDFSWQPGYGGFSCSITDLNALNKYIDNQKEHHKIVTYHDEWKRLEQIWGAKWRNDE